METLGIRWLVTSIETDFFRETDFLLLLIIIIKSLILQRLSFNTPQVIDFQGAVHTIVIYIYKYKQ
jgi:hypothetical protein